MYSEGIVVTETSLLAVRWGLIMLDGSRVGM
jgi:hypothetical protein